MRLKAIFYDWGGANVWLFHAINNVRGDLFDRVMWFGTVIGAHGNFPLYLAAIALMALVQTGPARGNADSAAPDRTLAWLVAITVFSLAFVVDGFLIGWIKTAMNYPRPLLALPPGSVHVIGPPLYHYSLPSGHSVFAATVASSLWPLARRNARVGFGVYVLWVGLSRISVGAHFPADVLAGFLLGFLIVQALRFAVRRLIGDAVTG